MQAFLDSFSVTLAADVHASLVDRAGWRISLDLRVPGSMTLVPPPPYAPELHPVERVWLDLRERFLSHRLHADYAVLLDAACQAWNHSAPEQLPSLTNYSWLSQVSS